MTRTLVLAALVSCAAPLLACKSSGPAMDIPAYPGSSMAAGMPNQESAAGTMFRFRRKTPDGVNTVAAFYEKELAQGRGLRGAVGLGPAFTDGNLSVERAGLATATGAPLDPARAGGYVVVWEFDGATYVEAWQWVPAAR